MQIKIIITFLILIACFVILKILKPIVTSKNKSKVNALKPAEADSRSATVCYQNDLDDRLFEIPKMDWFEKITGFKETNYPETQAKLSVINGKLQSLIHSEGFGVGQLEIVSLAQLQDRAQRLKVTGKSQFREVIDDVGRLHRDPKNGGALFQVASQFNLLEMVGPKITPEHGVTRYQNDYTQGPACAIAAGAATIFRNYLVSTADGGIGQTAERQLNTLDDFEEALVKSMGHVYFNPLRMQNGYALPNVDFTKAASEHICSLSEQERDKLRSTIKIGLHWCVQVTSSNEINPQIVSQAFCSAMPIAYSECHADEWRELARIVLEAAYESTLYAAALNAAGGGSNIVYLTSLGGGAFGNPKEWITAALQRAIALTEDYELDVRLVRR